MWCYQVKAFVRRRIGIIEAKAERIVVGVKITRRRRKTW